MNPNHDDQVRAQAKLRQIIAESECWGLQPEKAYRLMRELLHKKGVWPLDPKSAEEERKP